MDASGRRRSICIDVEGATIHGSRNGLLVATAGATAPDAILTAGVAGVVSRAAMTTTTAPPTPIFEGWTGGTLVPGACGSAGAVLLLAAKRADDVRLAWTGGVPPYDLER